MSRRILLLEMKNFLSGRGVIAGLVLLAAAGLYAIAQGNQVIEQQRRALAAAPRLAAEHRETLLAMHAGKTEEGPGGLLYYLHFSTVREPSRLAPLAVGLRDLHPYNLRVRLLALEGQLYDGDIANPAVLALGNFDVAFLLVFCYPLLVIAFLHNTLSAEQESGAWRMLCAYPVSPWRMLLGKALIRFIPILAVWLATLLAAVFWLDLPFDGRLLSLGLLGLTYLGFWFALALAVMTTQGSSNFNAVALLGCWLLLVVLAPVSLNLALSAQLPVPEAFELTILQREGYHNKWDQPKQATMRRFFDRYPQFAAYPVPEDRFTWAWYYAMQHMGDEEAATAAARWKEKLLAREQRAAALSSFIPPALVQSTLSRLCGTGLSPHIAYLDSVRRYHEELRLAFYPYLFQDPPVPPVDWHALPRHSFSDEEGAAVSAASETGVLSGAALILAAFAVWRFRRRSSVL